MLNWILHPDKFSLFGNFSVLRFLVELELFSLDFLFRPRKHDWRPQHFMIAILED
jgi:hypothetical protein